MYFEKPPNLIIENLIEVCKFNFAKDSIFTWNRFILNNVELVKLFRIWITEQNFRENSWNFSKDQNKRKSSFFSKGGKKEKITFQRGRGKSVLPTPKVGKFMIFLSLRFSVDSILQNSEILKLPFLPILRPKILQIW